MESKQQEREEQQRDVPALVAASDSGSGCEERDTHTVVDLISDLRERLDQHNESRRTVQEKLALICNELGKQADELEDKVNEEMEKRFTEESDAYKKR